MTTATNGKLWMLFPWALLGTALSGLGVMASLAAKDPGFSLEPDYYRKAVAWDVEQAERAKSARLGWTSSPTQTKRGVVLTLRDASGAPIAFASGQVEAFAIARAQSVQTVPLREIGPGEYEATIAFSRAGLWELRTKVRKGEDVFAKTLRLEVSAEVLP